MISFQQEEACALDSVPVERETEVYRGCPFWLPSVHIHLFLFTTLGSVRIPGPGPHSAASSRMAGSTAAPWSEAVLFQKLSSARCLRGPSGVSTGQDGAGRVCGSYRSVVVVLRLGALGAGCLKDHVIVQSHQPDFFGSTDPLKVCWLLRFLCVHGLVTDI